MDCRFCECEFVVWLGWLGLYWGIVKFVPNYILVKRGSLNLLIKAMGRLIVNTGIS